MNSLVRNEKIAGYVFISPFIIGFLSFTFLPIMASLVLSFTDFNLLTTPSWVGFDNYVRMFTEDDKYANSLKVTGFYVLLSVPLRLTVALLIALALNRAAKAIGLYRTVYYLPSIIGGSVAVAIMWRYLFGNEGAINSSLQMIGLDGIEWFADPVLALLVLVFLAGWQFGSSMLIFLAGLKNIPGTYYESASIDGANKVQQFFKITIPMLSPIILFNLVMQTIAAFITFTPAYIMTNGEGTPLGGTDLYTLYLFRRAFVFFDMGYASAMAWILLMIIAVMTLLVFKSSTFWVHYESDEVK